MLFRRDSEVWPDAPEGLAAYLHKLAVVRGHAGTGVSRPLIAECGNVARGWACSKLRLDCHPNLSALYRTRGFAHVDTFHPYEDPAYLAERFEVRFDVTPISHPAITRVLG
jgi:GNAT superfamily N-acetyltransferase